MAYGRENTKIYSSPLEKIPISDVSNAREIKNVIQSKMLARMQQDYKVHLNYTGGTKSMSTHVYWILREEKNLRQKNFSYLDARNFRLIDDEKGVIVDNLRTKINISLKNIIELHGFEKCNPDIQVNMEKDINEFESILKTKNTLKNINGHLLEIFVAARLKENFNNTNIQVLQNWKIKKPDWKNNDFELDVMLIYGYQLIGISCAIGQDKQEIKRKGFEIIQRTRQIGGDEAKAVLVTSFKSLKTKTLNDELMYDTGVSRGKIIVLGYEDIKTGEFVNRIKEFVSVY